MDKQELQQKIVEYYSKLPPEAQEFFSKMEWMQTLEAISKKYELDQDQAATLATETTLVLLGILSQEEYSQLIKKEINLSQESWANMLNDIEKSVLSKVGEHISKAYENNIKNIESENQTYELDEKFSSLSPELQEAIGKSGYQESILTLGEKYKLNPRQLGELGDSVVKTILGVMSNDQLEGNIRNLDIAEGKNKELLEELNAKVFIEIRNILMKKQPEVPTPPPAKPAPQPIEINPTAPKVTTPPITIQLESGEELLKKTEKPQSKAGQPLTEEQTKKPSVNPIMEQKMSGHYGIPKKESEHSLPNVTKGTEKTPEKPKVDPYREPVE